MRLRNILLFVVALTTPALTSAAEVMNLPVPQQYVEDRAGIIGPGEKEKLLGLLQELEQKTGAQVVVLTVPSLEGIPIEQVAIHLAHDQWKLGQKDKDNGLLVLVSLQDRAYRIEAGYGLEGVITDSVAGSIGRQFFVPHFKEGNYGLGLYLGTAKIAELIAQNAGVTLTGMPKLPELDPAPPAWLGLLVPIVFVLLILLVRGPLGWLLLGLGMSSAFRGWGGGSSRGGSTFGGFGRGGGFGSFGGGGGGGFGGGGASGRW